MSLALFGPGHTQGNASVSIFSISLCCFVLFIPSSRLSFVCYALSNEWSKAFAWPRAVKRKTLRRCGAARRFSAFSTNRHAVKRALLAWPWLRCVRPSVSVLRFRFPLFHLPTGPTVPSPLVCFQNSLFYCCWLSTDFRVFDLATCRVHSLNCCG